MLMEDEAARTVLDQRFSGIFPGRPERVAEARHAVARFLGGHPAAGDIALIVSELATNAVLYSASADGSFIVQVQIYPAYVWVEVQDAGGPWIPVPPDGRPHGLDIVQALTAEWGTDVMTGGGRVVWARVAVNDIGKGT